MPLSLEGKLVFTWIASFCLATLIFAVVSYQGFPLYLNLSLGLLLALPPGLYLLRRTTKKMNRSIAALDSALFNFTDKDFSNSLRVDRTDELGKLAERYNQAGEVLRNERQHIFQRELLLDTVLQSSPMAMLLLDSRQRIVYANHEARYLLLEGQLLVGLFLDEVLEKTHSAIADSLRSGLDGLLTVDIDQHRQTYHLSRGQFTLNSQQHELYLFKQMTREMNRKEVAIWKKVISVISHELNNSLAPISSMAHSGRQLLDQPDSHEKLCKVFNTIAERSQHLVEFIQGYSHFAKLPLPRSTRIDWEKFVEHLRQHSHFTWVGEYPKQDGWGDPAQLEQVMINLIKNASEAGSDQKDIHLTIQTLSTGTQINILDRGTGMMDEVLKQAILPFFSTKEQGTGLGLALCNDIIDAHDGGLSFCNREGGGLQVSLFLPLPAVVTSSD
ncbi:MAG: histidine kinase [Spongiibacteraceae bacterium]|nr:histidine kinase [Spongiibacteraceae bacterium]